MSENVDGPVWGPENPHPLSRMKTELVWEGKYDEWGNRRTVDPASLACPLQLVERIDAPRSNAVVQRDLSFDDETPQHDDDFRNRLIWGDNKLVMASLLEEFAGKVDLIYIDPPFDVGADFSFDVKVGDGNESFTKQPNVIEEVAYRDTWGRGAGSFAAMVCDVVATGRELLSESGSFFFHCDYRVSSLVRFCLDEAFGRERLRNEIIWKYSGGRVGKRFFGRKHDTIFWYTKSDEWQFYPDLVRDEYADATVERFSGTINNIRDGRDFGPQELNPEGKHPEDVFSISIVAPSSNNRTGYPTQKPEPLLEKLLLACSSGSDLILDFFCGSGTTGAVAEKLGRRWIMCDLGRYAIHTSRKRLIDLQRQLHDKQEKYRPFDVYNLGRYERQWWQKDRLEGADETHRRVVMEFYRAQAFENPTATFLHGQKGRAHVFVDTVDSLLTRDEVEAAAEDCAAAGGTELHCLAWEFEMGLADEKRQVEEQTGLSIKLVRIPREIMEASRKKPEDVQFFGLADLSAEAVKAKPEKKGGRPRWDVRLTHFLPSLSEVPEKEMEALQERAVENGFDFIDFWAVDFEYDERQPFRHHWQDYRTRKDRSLKTNDADEPQSDAAYEYEGAGPKRVCVKVVDVFGVDTSIVIPVV